MTDRIRYRYKMTLIEERYANWDFFGASKLPGGIRKDTINDRFSISTQMNSIEFSRKVQFDLNQIHLFFWTNLAVFCGRLDNVRRNLFANISPF